MALLQNQPAISRFPRETGGSILFYLGLIAFFIGLAAYGGLIIVNRGQEQASTDLTAEVRSKEEELRPELLNQIFLLDTRLKNLQTLIARHTSTAGVFQVVETNTFPSVQFSTFGFNADGHRIDMTGSAPNYATLSRQITAFEQDPRIKQVEFGGLSNTSAGQVGFKIAIILKQSALETP